jgi:hypothetical protein
MGEPPKVDLSPAVSRCQRHVLGLAERGMPSAEMRKFVTWAPRSDFQHPEALDLLSDSVIMTSSVRVRAVYGRQSWMRPASAACLAVYRETYRADEPASIQTCEEFAPAIPQGKQRFMTRPKDDPLHADILPDAVLQQTFRAIGRQIEEAIQQHLRELLEETFVEKGATSKRGSVAGKDLALVVNDLLQFSVVPQTLLMSGAWGIRVNQWRNIAQKATWQLMDGSVKFWHGVPPNHKEVLLTKDEIAIAAGEILNVELVLGAARAVFLFDRAPPLVHLVQGPHDQALSLTSIVLS